MKCDTYDEGMRWITARHKFLFLRKYTAVFWGAFDPPTEAHYAIIDAVLAHRKVHDLIVVVNNHSYKNYMFPLMTRLQQLERVCLAKKKVRCMWQDDQNPCGVHQLKQLTRSPLCAVAGYDAYQQWLKSGCVSRDRGLYQAIAVVPRGNEEPILFDDHAFLLGIGVRYRYVSSTLLRTSCVSNMLDSACMPASDLNASIK